MRFLLALLLWAFLLILCWPIAILILILFPLLWLLAIPFRLAAVVIEACLSLIRALLFLSSRILSPRKSASR